MKNDQEGIDEQAIIEIFDAFGLALYNTIREARGPKTARGITVVRQSWRIVSKRIIKFAKDTA
jgi:hypothetical protein